MIQRRKFIGTAFAASVAGLFANRVSAEQLIGKTAYVPSITKPKRLQKGDTIGLIAPGYAVSTKSLEKGKKALIKMGFIPHHTDRIVGNYGYFSNTDEERLADLHEMFANPKIDGILCARGGYGCTRIATKIDYDLIQNNPKVLIGFSDITVLHQAIFKETGLVTFHGPVGSTLEGDYSIAQLKQVVMYPKNKLKISNAICTDEQKKDPVYEQYAITDGIAQGKLVGGNLSLIVALTGTPHEIDFTNKIVCMEDIEEAPYRIDRMLTQLIEGKTFSKAAGILFGVSKGCNTSSNPKSFSLKEVLIDRLKPLNIPTVYGMSMGHVPDNFTFPIGIEAKLNTSKMTLKLLEKAVI